MSAEGSPELDEVDRLYELKPGEFVAARDRLAKRLKADGDPGSSAAVKQLRRPTVVAWALNQVARRHRDDVDELVDSGAAVRQAQAAAMGGGDPEALRQATRRRREVVRTLARAATDLAGPSHHDQVTATIDAASLDPDATSLFRRGRLTKELPAPSGFGIGTGVTAEPPAAPPPPPAPEADLDRLGADVARAEESLGTAGDRLAVAEGRLAEAEERLVSARAEVDAARAALGGAVADRDRARAAMAAARSTIEAP